MLTTIHICRTPQNEYLLLLEQEASVSPTAGLLDKAMLRCIFHNGLSQVFQNLFQDFKGAEQITN